MDADEIEDDADEAGKNFVDANEIESCVNSAEFADL